MRPAFLLFAVLALACDGSDYTGPPTTSPNTVNAVGASAWSPATITISTGDPVDFRNATGITHNVRFDPDEQGRPADVADFGTATRTVSFTTPGTYHFHCGIHPVMQGVVVVQP